MTRNHLPWLATLRLLLLFGGLAAARISFSADAALCPNRPIKLAFFETPVLYYNGQGLDKDFVDELQKRSKCRIETTLMPRARVWQELETGRLDMTTSVLPTVEREQSLWLLNYYQMHSYLILSKKLAGHIKSADEFLNAPKNIVFGQVRGYRYGAGLDVWINTLFAQGRVYEVPKTEFLYKMLAAERISAIAGSPMIYKTMLQEYGLTDKVIIVDWGGPGASSPRSLGLSKIAFSEAQAREWQILINDMQRDGTMRRLIEKYLDPKDAAAMLLP